MNSSKPGIPVADLDVLMSRIREEVARRKQAGDTPGAPGASPEPVACTNFVGNGDLQLQTSREDMPDTQPALEPAPSYSLDKFLAFDDDNFIRNAYLGILSREPDLGGREHHLNSLRSGQISKVEILGRLRYSEEGRKKAVRVRGLLPRFAWQYASRMPVIGYLLLWIKTLLRMPVLARNLQHLDAHIHHRLHSLQRHLDNTITGTTSSLDAIRGSMARLQEAQVDLIDNRVETLSGRLDVIEQNFTGVSNKDITALRSQLAVQQRLLVELERRLDLMHPAERPALPGGAQVIRPDTGGDEGHLLDAFYVSFEDKFRGTRQDIKQRAGHYLQPVRDAGAGTPEAPVLDIGCGRGEWLELLKDNTLTARGVDINRVMLMESRKRGLDVVEGEAGEYLAALAPDSLGAVTGIHIIEHIPFNGLIMLLDEVLRVLRPGGIAIFETPNPENLLVGSCNFYHDPSHLHPLPPEMMKFVLEQRGFANVSILRLHEAEYSTGGADQPVIAGDLKRLLYGPQDYAVIGTKL